MFKKIFPLVILVAVSIVLVLPAGLSADDALKIRVTAATANIRQSGFLSAPVVGSAQKGQIFAVVEKSGEWYLIQLADGTPGFIHSSVVEEMVEGETAPVSQPAVSTPPQTSAPEPVVRETAARSDTFSMFLARVGYFLASDSAYTEVYENGLVFGGELRVGGENLAGWLEGNYRSATGKLTYTKEETKMSVLGIEGGALYRFMAGTISPYLGAGLGYYMFNEKNTPIGEAKQSKLGFCGVGGVAVVVGGSIVLDARVKYSTCSMKPADFDINIGGLTLGAGLGIRF
ncbi:MAG: SH3 domain-containing protein [Candidatus Aminicenantes bacterium]|nr:SH3 domain-containing protein [Candidatus Aminicenantes bacterium]